MAVLKSNVVILFALSLGLNGFAQTVTNGNFSSGSIGRGCNPEASNPETTYGGSSYSNLVAEVDEEVGLC